MNIEESIRLANLEYKKHYFYPKTNTELSIKYNISSFDDTPHHNTLKLNMNYDLLEYKNLTQYIFIKSLGCKHLLHDDKWIKITNKNNILKDIEELSELTTLDNNSTAFVNSINSDDVSNILFLQFVDQINNSKYNNYSIEFKYINIDEDNEDVMWIVIQCNSL
jgi:hypothetical protein